MRRKTVKGYCNICTGEFIRVLFDGNEVVMYARVNSMQWHCEELKQNKKYHVCEVFTTAEGIQFIHSRNEKLDEDYLIKVENDKI